MSRRTLADYEQEQDELRDRIAMADLRRADQAEIERLKRELAIAAERIASFEVGMSDYAHRIVTAEETLEACERRVKARGVKISELKADLDVANARADRAEGEHRHTLHVMEGMQAEIATLESEVKRLRDAMPTDDERRRIEAFATTRDADYDAHLDVDPVVRGWLKRVAAARKTKEVG